MAWALLLATARRLGEAERFLRGTQWAGWGPRLLQGVDVHGKTLGIFGMGRIGQAVARRAKGFNMRVLYFDPAEPDVPEELAAIPVDKPTLLAESDFISIHCPLLRETRHAFGAEEFKAMKRSACLINTSRGPIVDEAALAKALESGEIRAAGLDVFEDEPRVHPDLLDCQNAVLSPHLGSATEETRGKMAEAAAKEFLAREDRGSSKRCKKTEESHGGLTVLRMAVGNPAKPEVTKGLELFIDSGVRHAVVPAPILDELGIKPSAEQQFRLADGSKIVRKKGVALFKYGGKVGSAEVIFGKEDDSVLVGTLTLEALGLALDPLKRQLKPLPRALGGHSAPGGIEGQ